MATDFNETPGAARYKKPSGGGGAGQLLKNPIFKLAAVLVVGGGATFAAMQYLSGPPEADRSVLPTPQASTSTTAATEITPGYLEAVQQQDAQRIEEARASSTSAMPTPLQNPVAAPSVDADVMATENADPIDEFDKLISTDSSSRGPAAPAQQAQQQVIQPTITPEQVQQLSRVMRSQMEQLMNQWTPSGMQTVGGGARRESAGNQGSGRDTVDPNDQGRMIVQAGSVYYGQMLMEANSDIPGPIMTQILTGPFAGGRAIGSFETYRNHLALRFKTIAIRNRQFSVDILALDPETTLGGVVTEVDPRYFTRVLLPAAAAFIKAYGDTIAEPASTTTVDSGGGSSVVTNNSEKNDSRDAMYKGLSEAADRVGDFVDEEASATKRLVRVAVGTPIGLFFVSAVKEGNEAK